MHLKNGFLLGNLFVYDEMFSVLQCKCHRHKVIHPLPAKLYLKIEIDL